MSKLITLMVTIVTIVTAVVPPLDDFMKADRLTVDGNVFTINQPDWKPSTFKLFGMELEDTHGFTNNDYLPLDNRGYADVMEMCKDQLENDKMPMYAYSRDSTVNYFPDSKSYAVYKGIDMIPQNKDNYVPGENLAKNLNFEDGKKIYDGDMMIHRCRVPTKDGGAWHVQRIGPFQSTGGYDWWSIGFPDVGMFSEVVGKYPQGIDVLRNILSPVLEDGTMLNLPPIHTHHTHVIPQRGIRPRMMERPLCLSGTGLNIPFLDNLIKEKDCYNFSQPFEQHGDYNCLPKDDGMDCLVLGDELPIRINEALDIEGELNDVRPKNSPPLQWYYQLAFRWKPADLSKAPVSGLVMIGPGVIDPANQLSKSYTSPVNPKEESIYTYSAELQRSGELIRAKLHSHASLLQGSMMFAGTYEDLGLADPKFRPPGRSYTQIYAKDIGFDTNEDFVQYVFKNLKQSQQRWDERCTAGISHLKEAICARRRPELKCAGTFNQGFAELNGKTYGFDRRPIVNCKPWDFVKGEPFTVVGLNKKVDYPYSWNDPTHAPSLMQQHHGFFFYYRDTSRTNSEMEGHLTANLGTFHTFSTVTNPTRILAIIFCLVTLGGPPVFGSTMIALQWIFFFILTGLFTLVLWMSVKVTHKVRERLHEMHQNSDKKAIVHHQYRPVEQTDDIEEDTQL